VSVQQPHILVITDFFFPDSTGGANKMAYFTSRGLAASGFNISIITRKIHAGLPDTGLIEQMRVFRYRHSGSCPPANFLNLRNSIRNLQHSLSSDAKNRFDLVIVHQPFIAAMLRHKHIVRDVPWLYNFHSSWGEEYCIKKTGTDRPCALKSPHIRLGQLTLNAIEKSVLRRCGKIIVLSRFMQDRLESIHGLSQKSVIIPGGVDARRYLPAPGKKALRAKLKLPGDRIILFTVRNMRQRMGLPNLIAAMAELKDEMNDLFLVIAGKGELEHDLKALAGRLDLDKHIFFTGFVPEERLPQFYQAADIFILPTEQLEGFGLVTLEALSSGLPVLGTPVGATPEILTRIGKEWLTASSGTRDLVRSIKERVRFVQQDSEAYQTVCHKCRQLIEAKYTWQHINRSWHSICQSIIETAAGSRLK